MSLLIGLVVLGMLVAAGWVLYSNGYIDQWWNKFKKGKRK